MTKTEKKVLKSVLYAVVAIAIGLWIGLCIRACNGDNGIIALEDYPHGVIICGEAMVINTGHYKDVEVKRLIDLAEKECPK